MSAGTFSHIAARPPIAIMSVINLSKSGVTYGQSRYYCMLRMVIACEIWSES